MIDTLRYWPNDAYIPYGWRYAGELGGNHGDYSFLIKRTWLGFAVNRNPAPVRQHLRIGKRAAAQ